MKRAILIFSKSPELGKVKTRMRPVLNDSQCLSLHLALLQDTILKCRKVHAETILYLSGSVPLPFSTGIPVTFQEGADLGDRMKNAFAETLPNFTQVAIVGIDSPTFSPQILRQAFDGLITHDAVIGPAADGGYYLIGLHQMIPEIFHEVPWGSNRVLQKTLDALPNRKVLLLPVCFDVDEPADLMRLRIEIDANRAPYLEHTRRWFKALPGQNFEF